jgi:hypothetical protein
MRKFTPVAPAAAAPAAPPAAVLPALLPPAHPAQRAGLHVTALQPVGTQQKGQEREWKHTSARDRHATQ